MAKNITYLIGAGASYGIIPIVNQLPKELIKLSQELGGTTKELMRFRKELDWLGNAASTQSSIDTLARQFHTADDPKLRDLKAVLTIYFNYLQIKRGINPRYDLFFATLYNKETKKMPDNIKIISWNYDNQFEISFNNFTRLFDMSKLKERLGVVNKGEQIPTGDSFKIFKVNGTAKLVLDKDKDVPFDFFRKIENEGEFMKELGTDFIKAMDDSSITSSLSFAWETGGFGQEFFKVVEQTDILVIIGYSFPDFNRYFDTSLIGRMLQNVEKIYIQDMPEMYNPIERKLRDIMGPTYEESRMIRTATHAYNREFYIPQDFFDDGSIEDPRTKILYW